MVEQFIYDTAVIGCLLVSSGFSLSILYGAAEELYYKHKDTE